MLPDQQIARRGDWLISGADVLDLERGRSDGWRAFYAVLPGLQGVPPAPPLGGFVYMDAWLEGYRWAEAKHGDGTVSKRWKIGGTLDTDGT